VIGLFGDAGNVQDQRDRHTDHQVTGSSTSPRTSHRRDGQYEDYGQVDDENTQQISKHDVRPGFAKAAVAD
jgi:hypothetical protein